MNCRDKGHMTEGIEYLIRCDALWKVKRMRKWFGKLLVISLILLSVLICRVNAFAEGNFVIDNEGYLIEYNGHDEVVVIPDTVKVIDSFAFSGNEDIIEVIIPDGVEVIGPGAFSSCTNLEKVKMPDSVTMMWELAFSLCDSLRSIRLSENLDSIEQRTFEYCTSLEEIVIPGSVEHIDMYAFHYCTELNKSSNLRRGNRY